LPSLPVEIKFWTPRRLSQHTRNKIGGEYTALGAEKIGDSTYDSEKGRFNESDRADVGEYNECIVSNCIKEYFLFARPKK
jgi:hypothetical protein